MLLCFCSFQDRARVTASVVDIESDAHTVLFPATVSDRGSGNYEVRRCDLVEWTSMTYEAAQSSRQLSIWLACTREELACQILLCNNAQVSFKPEISATYGLAIVLDGTPLQGSPFKIKIRNDETIAGNCRLYGPGLTLGTAGQHNQFCIQGVRRQLRLDLAAWLTSAAQHNKLNLSMPPILEWLFSQPHCQ